MKYSKKDLRRPEELSRQEDFPALWRDGLHVDPFNKAIPSNGNVLVRKERSSQPAAIGVYALIMKQIERLRVYDLLWHVLCSAANNPVPGRPIYSNQNSCYGRVRYPEQLAI